MREIFGYRTRMLGADELRRDYCDEREAAGALFEAEGIGIHPLKFSFGLMRKARALGAKLHTAEPGAGLAERSTACTTCERPGGTVRARRVAVCTGGYTGQALSPMLKNRIMPILSNSVVTRPLTDAELQATQLSVAAPSSPTRARCASTTGCCPTTGCNWAAAAAVSGADARGPGAPEAADRRDRAQVPAAGRHRHRLLVVGLGRRQPRHDAAHHAAGRRPAHLVCGRLRRQRGVVLDLGRQAAGRARGRQGRRAGRVRAADLQLAAAVSERARAGRIAAVRAVPAARPARARTSGTGCATRNFDRPRGQMSTSIASPRSSINSRRDAASPLPISLVSDSTVASKPLLP